MMKRIANKRATRQPSRLLVRRSSSMMRSREDKLIDEIIREARILCATTGARLAFFTTTQDGRTRSYGNPSPELVLEEFLARKPGDGTTAEDLELKESDDKP